MQDLSKYKEIIIWGACFPPEELGENATSNGKAADKLINLLKKNNYDNKVLSFIDSNTSLQGKTRLGYPVVPPHFCSHTPRLR